MTRVAREFLQLFALFIVDGRTAIIWNHHRAPFAVGHDANAGAAVLVHFAVGIAGRQSPHFEDEGCGFIIVEHDESIGCGAIIHVAEAAPNAQNARRKLVYSQDPTGDVHLVNALVAQIAVARRPHPMPVIVEAFAHERFFGSRTTPQIVINVCGDRLRSIDLANAGAALVTEPTRAEDFSDVAFAQPGDALGDPGAGTGLGTGLHDAAILARRLDELPALPDVVRNWLLDIDIFSRLDRPN